VPAPRNAPATSSRSAPRSRLTLRRRAGGRGGGSAPRLELTLSNTSAWLSSSALFASLGGRSREEAALPPLALSAAAQPAGAARGVRGAGGAGGARRAALAGLAVRRARVRLGVAAGVVLCDVDHAVARQRPVERAVDLRTGAATSCAASWRTDPFLSHGNY